MKYSYAYKKFTQAVDSMAVGSETIQNRIIYAYNNYLMQLDAEELPEEIRHKIKGIYDIIRSAELKRMAADEAVNVAKEIIRMAEVVRDHYHRGLDKRYVFKTQLK
jgi:hypothetical protein